MYLIRKNDEKDHFNIRQCCTIKCQLIADTALANQIFSTGRLTLPHRDDVPNDKTKVTVKLIPSNPCTTLSITSV